MLLALGWPLVNKFASGPVSLDQHAPEGAPSQVQQPPTEPLFQLEQAPTKPP